MTRWKWIAFGIIAAAIVGAAGFWGYRSSLPARAPEAEEAPPTVPVAYGSVKKAVSAPGQMVEKRKQTVRVEVEGQLSEVLVQPGDEVSEGQVLARFSGKADFEAKAAAAKLDWLQAQQDLEDLKANAPKEAADAQLALLEAQKKLKDAQTLVEALKYPRAGQERIDAVYNDYQQALQNVAIAQDTFDGVKNLADYDPRRVGALNTLTAAQKQRDSALATYNWLTGKPTDEDVAKAQADLKLAQAQADVAERAWDRLKDGPDETKLELAQAKAADLEAKYQRALADLEHLEVKAPFQGVVAGLKAQPGDALTVGMPLLDITDPRALEAEVTVVEEDWPLIKPGQAVQLYLDASTEADLMGKVARVVPVRALGDRPVYPVYITPDGLPEGVAPGMTVDTSIIIDSREDVLTLPKAMLRIRGDGTAEVEVWKNGAREKRQVRLGLIGDQNVEILEGLAEGEQVVGQ